MGLGLGIGVLLGVRSSVAEMVVGFILLAIGLLLLAALSQGDVRRVLLFVSAGVIGGWSVAEMRSTEHAPTWQPPASGQIEGVVRSDPRVTTSGSRALVSWTDDDGFRREAQVFLPAGSHVGRADRVLVFGVTGQDGGSPVVFASSVVTIERAGWLETQRRSIRQYASRQMLMYVPGAAGSLTLGLLIGDDTGLSSAERIDLRTSGLSHITAVSGWNVSVIVASVGALFTAAGARGWRWLSVQLALLAGYVWIVGLEPPIQRAAIMGAVALMALQLGRPAHMLTLLTLTAGVMAAWNPDVFNSLSFLLSFLSMLGLVVAARISSGMTGWTSVALSPAIAASAAGIATAPLLAASFGTVALMTVPANLLAGPLIPLATFAGIGVVAASWLPPMAEVAGWLDWTLSNAVLWISRMFAGVPGGHHTTAPLDPSAALTIYAGLAMLIAPFFPEGKALARRMERWFRSIPLVTTAGVLVAVGMLAIGAALG